MAAYNLISSEPMYVLAVSMSLQGSYAHVSYFGGVDTFINSIPPPAPPWSSSSTSSVGQGLSQGLSFVSAEQTPAGSLRVYLCTALMPLC